PGRRHREGEPAISDRPRGESTLEQAHHTIPDRQILDAWTDLEHHTRTLTTNRVRPPVGGHHSQRSNHISEVHTRAAHRHTHLPLPQRPGHLRRGNQTQILKRAGAAQPKTPIRLASRRAQSPTTPPHKPRHISPPVTNRKLR